MIVWDEITLSNVVGGGLEQLFQEKLPEVIEALSNPTQYEPTGKEIRYTLQCELQFCLGLEVGNTSVNVRVVAKPPKPRTYGAQIRIDEGRVEVERAYQQELRFEATKRGDGEDGG